MSEITLFVRSVLEREKSENNLTWEELAQKMQADPSTLYRWITARTPVGSPQVESFLSILLRQNPELTVTLHKHMQDS